jgi:hypothetical protein
MRLPIGYRVIIAVVLATVVPSSLFARSGGIDSKAVRLLEKATKFLAEQQRFTVQTQSTLEGVLTSGQKIEFDFSVNLAVERPNRLRAERVGDVIHQVFYYDGSTLTLSNPDDLYFATTTAPATLDGMLDYALQTLDIAAPGGDLLYSNAFDKFMEDVESALVVGESVIDGVRCHHLAFHKPYVDWQMWIEKGDRPLVRKMVIASTDVEGAPEYSVVLTDYDFSPKFADGTFHFDPPEDATAIAFLSTSGGFVAE